MDRPTHVKVVINSKDGDRGFGLIPILNATFWKGPNDQVEVSVRDMGRFTCVERWSWIEQRLT